MAETLYVLGHPVGHSKSPVMHNAAYRALGLDWTYGLMDCAHEEDAHAFLSARQWLAVNVTMPYKPLAYRMAQGGVRTSHADLAQGANVLVKTGDTLFADNTDGKGCISYLRRRGFAFESSRVAVCGTGPTSLAILHAAAQAGAARIALLGRDAGRCAHVLDEYQERTAGRDAAVMVASSYGEGLAEIADADLVVDATSLGMNAGDPAPFDTSALSARQMVFDVVYGHGITQTIADARAAGCKAYDGEGMLVAQAVETVIDIAQETGAFSIPDDLDLFGIMSRAAGFDL